MIIDVFHEIANEARSSKIDIVEDGFEIPIRVGFNVALERDSSELYNIYIKDKKVFNNILNNYVLTALDFHNLELTHDNVKKILTYAFVNMTKDEMKSFDNYLLKYIEFYKNSISFGSGFKNTSLGLLKYSVDKQSFKQETPYCFNSHFEKDSVKYCLPRISFGINNGICYIYAIQNKANKLNMSEAYNEEVRKKLRTINSGVSKYRNVTPSFVCSLVLFISFLKKNGINEIKVVTPLPLREQNRELSSKQRIKVYTMQGNLDQESIEKLIKQVNEKKEKDNYNASIKFLNCFKRLKIHFKDIEIFELNNETLLKIIDLSTNSSFLRELILGEEIDYGKISKHSSC